MEHLIGHLIEQIRDIVAVGQLDNDIWYHLGPHLTCTESDTFVRFLRAIGDDRGATILMESHADSDDEGDRHYKEGGLDGD